MKLILALLVAFAAVTLLAWVFQRRLIYFPYASLPPPADVGLTTAETVTFDTEDHMRLGAWFVPARTEPGATIVVFNGNAGNRAFRAPLAAALSEAGFSVLVWDYRGFAGNPGSPSEEGLAADARAVRRYIESRWDVDPTRLVYFGESLGSGVAIRLALESPPAALILRSPYTSLVDLARTHYPFLPVRQLLRDRFPSIDRIGRLTRPLLVIAGDRDSIVPFEQSRRLFEAAREPKRMLIVHGADHNDQALLDGELLLRAVTGFLRETLPVSR
jgi:hypothetical protein